MNRIVLAAAASWLLAQLIKCLLCHAHGDRLTWRVVLGTGGMPSAHTAFVCATALGVGLTAGFDSVAFALGFALACVVVYDALGVRREAGRHAAAINRLEAQAGLEGLPALCTSLGHRPMEVFAGALLGFAVTGLAFALL